MLGQLAFAEQMRNNIAMDISLTIEQEALVKQLVDSGSYQSIEAAITAALKGEAEFRAWEKREVQKGIAAADLGRLIPLDDVVELLRRDHEEQAGPQDWSA